MWQHLEVFLSQLGVWRPEMLLNVPQCIGQPLGHLAQDVSGAELEKP